MDSNTYSQMVKVAGFLGCRKRTVLKCTFSQTAYVIMWRIRLYCEATRSTSLRTGSERRVSPGARAMLKKASPCLATGLWLKAIKPRGPGTSVPDCV
jgi:hypothetical protein